jgi:hypothetical protein
MCSDCRERYSQSQKPQCESKGFLAIGERMLSELASVIKGISYPGISYVGAGVKANANFRTKTKGASTQLEKQFKLKELGRMVEVFRKRPSIDYWFSLMSSHEFCKIYPTYVLEI